MKRLLHDATIMCLWTWLLAMGLALAGCSSPAPVQPLVPSQAPATTQLATPSPTQSVKPKVTKSAKPKPSPKATKSTRPPQPKTDPRFSTCSAAKAAGYGPYTRGQDPEYYWYRDGDKDGDVCE